MPIRRARTHRPTLRHLAFVEALARTAPYDADARTLTATLLTLRLLDEWRLSAAVAVGTGAAALRATREAVAAADDAEIRAALDRVLDAMVMLQEPDLPALGTRLDALAALYAARQRPALADALRQALADVAPPQRSDAALEPA